MDKNSSPPGSAWYYFDGQRPVGPFTSQTLLRLRQGGLIHDETPVSCGTDQDWRSFGSLEQVRRAFPTDKSQEDLGQKDPRSTAEEDNAAFPVRFGSNFIPSSGGFKGSGRVLISAQAVEIHGHFALPLFLEFLFFLALICGFFIAGLMTEAFIPRAAVLVAAVVGYKLIRRRRRFDRSQIAEPIRKESAVIIEFRPGVPQSPIQIRAGDAAAAEEMAGLIKHWPEGFAPTGEEA
jgi:hypothetical protein